MFQWRKFDFFSEKMVTEEGSNEPHPALARPDYNITCTASGRNQLLVGDATGGVTIFDRNFNIVMWFEAHAIKVTHMRRLKTRNILITVGEDSGDTLLPVLKVWNLDKINKHGYPERARSKDLVPDRSMASPVTTVECLEDLKQVAVGLASGYVIIVYGNDISRDRFTHTRTLPPLDPSLPEPVTGLGWRTVGSSDAQQALLFVATLERVIVYNTAQRDRTSVLDDIGCEMGASVMSDNDDFIIGKREAVYFYEPDGRGACFIFEGHKKRIFWFRSYLCVVFREENDDDRLLIYDLNHKLRAYEHKFEDVTDIVSEWGSIFLLTRSGVVHQLEELDTNTKLDLLYKKKAYPVAISLAKNEDTISASDIYRRYGDHLYDDKGDYERAIEQYIHTIGRLEPSYVIRKFLDSQRIHNLTKYLQELHSKRKATREHTTLLLNCYTKLKDLQNLDAFIKTGDAEVTFDVQTAIKVLRQARYYDHALYLAQEYNEHDDFLKIQLEDIGAQNAAGYEEALSYIETLDFDAAEQNVKKYGKSLMTNLPDATTALIINLCTVGDGGALDGPSDRDRLETHDDFGAIPTAPISMPAMMARSNYNSAPTAGYDDDDVPEDLSALLGGPVMAPEAPADASMRSALFSRTKALVGDVRSSLHLGGGQSTSTAPPPPASYGGQASGGASDSLFSALPGGGAVRGSAGGAVKMSRPARRARLSKPNEFIHIFVDHPDLLVHFLEVVVEQRGDDASLSSVVHNTLLELYLTAEEEERFQAAHGAGAASVGPGGAAISRAKNTERMEKALKLLQNQNVAGDMAQALILCKLYNFREGMLYVYEKLMQFDEIVQVYMEENDYENILQSCRDYGAQLPDLWIRVLSYFAGRDDTRTEIAEVLKNIDDNNLLPPLRVIQILSANPSATLNTVKDYIQRRLQTENALIADDQAKIDHYLVETTKMREEIHELRTSAKMFQTHKCTMCNSPLDLPAVHFLCMHSFHQRCLGDSENECPVCEPDNRQVISVRQNWDKNLHNHEPFFHQLETAQDGFSVASEYFGKCIFSKISLLDDDEVAARNYDANLTDRERLFQ